MKRSQLALAVAGLLASSASFALVNHADTTTAATLSNWASEIGGSATQSSVIKLPGCKDSAACAGGDTLNIKFPVGVGMNSNTQRFIRVDLTGGATFVEDPKCEVYINGSLNSVVQCNKTVGGKGANYTSFSISSGSAVLSYADAIQLNMTNGGLYPSGTTDPVGLTYSIHNSPQSSELGSQKDTASIFNKAYPYVTFQKGLVVSFTAGSELTSEVTADFKKFSTGNGSVTKSVSGLGGFYVGAQTGTIYAASTDGNYAVALTNTNLGLLVGTGTTLQIEATTAGGFAFLQNVSGNPASGDTTYTGLAPGRIVMSTTTMVASAPDLAVCDAFVPGGTNMGTAAASVSADKVTFNMNDSTKAPIYGLFAVCMKANEATIIPTNIFSARYSPTSVNGSKPDVGSTPTIGKITQNGTTLDTPFFTLFPGYQSKVFLVNTGNTPVDYTTELVTDETATITYTTTGNKMKGTVPANSMYQINIGDLVASITNTKNAMQTRVAARFTLTGPNKSLNGVYQVIRIKPDGTGSDMQSIPLIRKGGG